ncbi:MAG: DNA polymerase I [Candidatus Moranbacteria bacterium]|nr:DNA polymerase I [Candidatus Moranbacteria bacterium]
MPNTKPEKIILIDGNAIIHRSYHALPPFTTKNGELVNAVYGFASTLLSIIAKFEPKYIIATFDLAGPTFRHIEYADYKATRVKADEALYAQIPRVKEVTEAFGIPIYAVSGFEADDVIGTLSKQAKENSRELETIIVTGDMDTLQLVNDTTKVYTMRRGLTDAVLYGTAEIFERFSLAPEQLIDYKGLRGDPSDNIPGVKGIGEKTAIELLKTYGTLENVYTHLEEIKKPVREKLEKDKLIAIQSKGLATIDRAVPVELDLDKAVTKDFDKEKLIALFTELNFHSLKKRLLGTADEKKLNTAENKNTLLEKSDGVKDFKFEIANKNNYRELLENLIAQKELAIKLKTNGATAHTSTLSGIAISYKTGRAIYFDLENKEIFAEIKNLLENPAIEKICFDLKSDLEILQNARISLAGNYFDILLASYVLSPGRKITLPDLVAEFLQEEMTEESKKGQLGLEIESAQEVAEKNCSVADYIFKLKSIQKESIEKISAEQVKNNNSPKHTLNTVFTEVEIPLAKVLAQMELAGIKLNTMIFAGISQTITERIAKLEENIYKLSGTTFNIASPKQLSEVLFEKMHLPVGNIKKGKSGVISTASAELDKLRGEHKIIEKIEEYREITKLKNTYLDTLPTMVDKNSRLHSTFNQAVTATGRLSSSDPNLQNIPTRTDLGQLLRTAFVAKEGYKLVSADYSQIDLRVVAHVSEDKKMIELFHKGEDIHRATAAEINNLTLSQVSDKIRRTAKELNFGVIYGMGSFGFAARAGISRDDAKRFIDTYFEKFQGVANYMREIKEFAKKNGYVETEIGRRRYISEINSSNFQVQSAAERMAINMPIQGLASDIMKIAMLHVAKEFENNPDVKMLLQVHDEIILEVREDLAETVSQKIKAILEDAYKLKVPLVANVSIGDNWGEL